MTFDVLKRHGWTVTLPVDTGLARLLRAGTHASRVMSPAGHKVLLELASAAEQPPAAGARAVRIKSGTAGVAAGELSAILARARAESDPAADALAAFLAGQFGVTETESAP